MDAVSSSLERRQLDSPRGLRVFIVASLVGHLLLTAVAIFGPGLLAPDYKPPLRYVEVISIPAAALQPGPVPTPPTAPAAAIEAEPEPERPEPEPDLPPREPPPEAPVFAEREPEPEPEPERPEPPEESSEAAPQEVPPSAVPGDRFTPGVSSGTSRDASFVGFDDPEFSVRYSYYLQQLLAAIKRGWTRPGVPEGVELVVSFRIQRQSRAITDLQVLTPSGSRPFDRAGVIAVQNARIPPLPQAYRKDSIGVQVIFR